MGLLSDPEYGSVKWVRVLKRVHRPLCFLCYAGSLVWFVLLANREFNNETYFSENALLPGLVINEFNDEQSAQQFFQEYVQELEDKYDDTDKIPVPWLVAKMSQLHLEVYTHNFTLNYPLGDKQVFRGTNVYGILRAPRTSSLEALVVTVPFRPLSSYQKGTGAGIALMLAFAKFARPQKYWAKDIIFLVTEHEQLGMQAWLEAYHGLQSDTETFYSSLGSFWRPGSSSPDLGKLVPGFEWLGDHSKCLNPGTLKGRSGSIQAAINLEFHTPKIKYIEVKVEGLNGQLPNLDLVNLVNKLCVKSGIHHSFKNSYSWMRNRNKMEEWTNGIWTMLGMVMELISGVPNGNHGLFHRFGIEAVTLEGRDANDPGGAAPRVHALTSANFYRLGIALESVLRSLNNLLERFHQSYFFYLLAATNRFISIGQYMPSLCLLCVAMLVRALSLWVTIQKETEEDIDKDTKDKSSEDKGSKEINDEKLTEDEVPEEKDSEKTATDVPGDKHSKEIKKVKEDIDFSIVSLGANYLLIHVLGYAVMNSPVMFSYIGRTYFDTPSEISVFYGLVSLSIILAAISPFLLTLFHSGRITHEEMCVINILVLVELATACLAIGMHNFPLGLLIAALYTPLALVVGAVGFDVSIKSSTYLMLRRVLCLCLSPLCVLTACAAAYSRRLFPEEGPLAAAGRGRDAAVQIVMFSVVDSLIYGNWLFSVATTIIFPTWLIFWQILCNRVVIH